MSHQAFSFSSPNTISNQPNGAGEKLIFRSDNAADDELLSITGLVAAVSTTETSALTVGKVEKETTATFTSFTIGQLAASQVGVVTIYGQGTAATGDLRVDTLPANNDTLIIGLTGFLRTYTFKTTLTGAANEIKIAANTTLQATYIYEAINAGSGAGTDYGTGTVAHAQIIATAPTVSVVPLTDRIKIARLLTWSLTQGTGATIAIRTMIGGVTGTVIGFFSIGATTLYDSFSLSTEDITTDTLPALFTGSSNAISTGGRSCTLRFRCENISSAIACSYQTSTDGTNWTTGLVSITSLDNISIATSYFIHPTEANVEQIRFTVGTNANTAGSALDARVIY